MWKPKDPKARATIRLTLWSGLLAWVVFTLALGVLYARLFALLAPNFLSEGFWGQFLAYWVGPIWIIFTVLMLVWAVVRFASRKLHPKNSTSALELTEKDIRAIASRRFGREHVWQVAGGVLGAIALAALAQWLSGLLESSWPVLATLAIYLGLLVWYWRASGKYERKLVEDWKKSIQK